MKHKKHITQLVQIFLFLVLSTVKTTAQSYFFRHYQVENGLSNSTVFCSAQDKYGFLWFGTKDGLNRFDGYHFKHYEMAKEGHVMMPDMIGCMLVDNDNRLWIGSQKGLFYFDREKEKLVRFIDSLVWINSMHMDKDGQLWFISAVMLCRYNFKTNTLTKFPQANYFAATSICSSDNGDVWVSTDNGLLQRFDAATGRFKPFNLFAHSPPAVSTWIQKLHTGEGNSIYAGTSAQGLKQFDVATGTYKDLLTYNPDKTTIYIRDIARNAVNEFWFATESGIFILNTSTGEFVNLKKNFTDPYSLSDNAVYSLCKDNEGGMWAGTYFGGVNYYSRQYAVFQKYFPDNSAGAISGNAVREITGDHQGNIWIGTEDAGLNKLNPKTGAITQFKPAGEKGDIAYPNVHGLLLSGNDLWIGTFDHGLDILDVRTGKVKKHYNSGPGKYDLKNNFVVSLLQTHDSVIYAGTAGSLYRFNPAVKGFDLVTEIDPNIFVAALLEDHEKTIWAGSHGNGILFFNPVTKKKGYFHNEPDNPNSLPNNIINAIFEDSHQSLWLATEGGGLVKLDKDRHKFSFFTTKNGLPSNFIYKILEDDKQHLWVTTSRGLVNFNTETNVAAVYTKDNGLLNDQFNYNSGYKDSTGKMYFGSVKGMIAFRPDDLLKTTLDAPVFITGFQVQNKEVEINQDSSYLKKSILYTDNITLPYDRSSFSIDFAALSYISPEMTGYSYLMRGLDKEWTELKQNRKIYFTNLVPGKYVFKIRAGNNGNWGTEKQLVIVIAHPWWATVWAYSLYALFIIALSWYLLRTYHIIVEDKKEKEIYEAKIDFFTNVAHEIRTPLTLIKGPVENLLEQVDELPQIKEDVVTMERNTNRLIALITQILDFRKAEAKGFSMDFVKVNVSALLRESFENFAPLAKKRKLEYTIEYPDNDMIIFADEEALTKIFSNLFNNALKYANKKIAIRLLPANESTVSCVIEFENDGLKIPAEMREKIFEPFYRLKDSLKQQGTGIGLALARSLTLLHNGSLYLKDTADNLNVFVFCLPLQHEENIHRKKNINQPLLKLK
ncbi:MAG: histidine kinase [Ferruginibacter sp.]|uniref:sensor histidine kinase n=1 Tax=Ferruginibacter sp. TaxID=1940288 RepID=UPI002659B3B2|nr:sensor histidine kinase [Ferruginibacter sp.]MDB5278744.1 histidine kinase [Ferruginibacter sp.]